eukprot:9334455-Lingulodinium_polyedra.AAC.1
MVTFDGGSRKVRGHDIAAGAAVPWTRSEASAPWVRKMTTTCAVPSSADARTAEALAAGVALDTLLRSDCPPGPAKCSGDNLGVVRFCAGSGRLTEPHLHGILDGR